MLTSETQPELVTIGEKQVPIAEIAAAAFKKSGLRTSEWNDLEVPNREGYIAQEITERRLAADTARENS